MKKSLRTALAISIPSAIIAVGVVSALFAGPTPAPTNANTQTGACSSNGVTLVVDFGLTSGLDPIVKCASNFSGTGWQLFEATKTEVEGTAQYASAFVCRVAAYPAVDVQDCADTPTYDEGTWVYYFATVDAPDLWMLSSAGSAQRSPECGSYEGWVFVTPDTPESQKMPSIKPAASSCK
jgi:hypothetical protein